MSLREPDSLPWLMQKQLEYQEEEFNEIVSLNALEWLVLVWRLALEQGHHKSVEETEEFMRLRLWEIWGEGAEASFNRDKRIVVFTHAEGLTKTFYANDLE